LALGFADDLHAVRATKSRSTDSVDERRDVETSLTWIKAVEERILPYGAFKVGGCVIDFDRFDIACRHFPQTVKVYAAACKVPDVEAKTAVRLAGLAHDRKTGFKRTN